MNDLRHDRRILPGSLGLCTIPVLALLAGSLASMTTGAASGIAAAYCFHRVNAFADLGESDRTKECRLAVYNEHASGSCCCDGGNYKAISGVVALDDVTLQVRQVKFTLFVAKMEPVKVR